MKLPSLETTRSPAPRVHEKQNRLICNALLVTAISHAGHGAHSPAVNSRAGVIRIAILSLTVLQVRSQMPHPTQRLSATLRRYEAKSIDKASTGHCATQALHPCPAVHVRCDTRARPMRTLSRPEIGTKASVPHAVIHGKS